MSDHTSAEIFGELFHNLALDKKRTKSKVMLSYIDQLAGEYWYYCKQYDFSPWQMNCAHDLEYLGFLIPGTEENDWDDAIYGPVKEKKPKKAKKK